MSVFIFFPSQDTTIYSQYPTTNTGIDEILDLSRQTNLPNSSGGIGISRILMQYDQESLLNKFNSIPSNVIASGSYAFNLSLINADVAGLSTNLNLITSPIAQQWDMGTGRSTNTVPVSNGATWENATIDNKWLLSGYVGTYPFTSSYSYSSSQFDVSVTQGGGNWFLGLQATQSFGYYTPKNIYFDVTSIVNQWLNNSIPNNGFIIRNNGSLEFNPNFSDTFNFFSVDTNSIYPPSLVLKYDDSSYISGSNPIISTDQILITIGNNKQLFYEEENVRFRVYVNPQFPDRFFSTGSNSLYKYQYILPSSSYYQIKDSDTNMAVIPFDTQFTKISCDTSGSFFNIDMNGLQPDRYYSIQVMVQNNGLTNIYDVDGYTFKVGNSYYGNYV